MKSAGFRARPGASAIGAHQLGKRDVRMKLHWSPRSPFVRKVMITASALGLVDRLDCVRTVASATKPHPELMKDSPLSKIPTLVLDDGTVIFDSPVICEYLDRLHDKPGLFPAPLPERMTALRRQALGDGFLDFLLLWRRGAGAGVFFFLFVWGGSGGGRDPPPQPPRKSWGGPRGSPLGARAG